MELQKGICFLCYNASVIKDSQSQKISDLITFLLPKEINSTEFIRVQAALKLCPICYHKLIIAKRTSKNVKTDISSEVSNCCIMCKSERDLFQINSWPNFNAISEGMVFSKNNNCVTCSECLFYLDTKNNLKTKLLSKYPELQNKRLNNNETKRKWKLKFSPKMKLQSTPLRERNKYKSTSKKRKFVEIEDSLSKSENSSSKRNINLDAIKKFKPLKNFKLYKNHKMVKIDSKFLNQVPYVLLSVSDIYKSTFSENDMTKCNEENGFMETSHQNISPVSLEDENFKVRNESDKITTKNNLYGIQKYLVVNISRMNIEKYLVSDESDQEVQNSIDKLDTSQSSNDTEEDIGLDDSLTGNNDNILEEVEASIEIKNKRKSVSFAEDKNVEIEYFENNSEKQRNHNSVGENSEVVGKKLSKGILKREENVGEGKETSEKQNEGQSEEVDELDGESNESVQNNKHEHVSFKATKLKLMNRRNSYFIDENTFAGISDSEDDDLSILNKSKIQEITDVILLETDEDDAVEDENASQKEKETGRAKHKPLGRKKQVTVLEVLPDNAEHLDNDQCITREDNEDKIDNSEATTDEQSEETALKGENAGEDNDNAAIVPRPSVDKVENGNVEMDKPKPLSKKKKPTDAPKDLDEEVCSEDDLDNGKDGGILNKEKTKSTKTISGSEDKGGSTVREVCSEANDQDDIHDDKSAEKDSGEDEILNDTEKPTGGNETKSDLNSSQKSIITKDTNVSELCKEVLNKNVADTISVDREENDLTSVPASSKSDAISESDLTRLVNKYLNDPDADNTPKEVASNSLDKHCDEELINGSNVTDDEQKTDCSTSTPCNKFPKNDELGISEDDNDNINSLLSHIFPSDVDEINSGDETKKRKVSDDELNISKEKKKKKVSFCNDVT